jgi:hypothetical protein
MERMSIFAMLVQAGVEAAQAQVSPPQAGSGPGTAVAAAPAASSNPSSSDLNGNLSGATKGNPSGITFCSTSGTSTGFILGAPNCGADPLSVPTSVISSAGSAIGAAAASTGPGASSSTGSRTTVSGAASNSAIQGPNNSASQVGASAAVPCSLTISSTAGTLNPGGLFGGC